MRDFDATDLLHALFDYEGPDVALSWVWQQVDYTDMLAFYRMGHATSYDEFEAALALVTSPGINVSYADVNDNIAWWAAGKIPIRPDHVPQLEGEDDGDPGYTILGRLFAWGYIRGLLHGTES